MGPIAQNILDKSPLTYTSLPYATFELFNPCPQHNEKVHTALRPEKLDTKQKPLDLYEPVTGLGTVT